MSRHPATIAGTDAASTRWRVHALCQGLGADLFFPIGEIGAEAVAQVEAAKEVCDVCPVKEPCLEYSLATNQEFGVWGGLTPDERRRVRRARRRVRTAT
jgi:WhiB family redox-sensing transcriptional regulator